MNADTDVYSSSSDVDDYDSTNNNMKIAYLRQLKSRIVKESKKPLDPNLFDGVTEAISNGSNHESMSLLSKYELDSSFLRDIIESCIEDAMCSKEIRQSDSISIDEGPLTMVEDQPSLSDVTELHVLTDDTHYNSKVPLNSNFNKYLSVDNEQDSIERNINQRKFKVCSAEVARITKIKESDIEFSNRLTLSPEFRQKMSQLFHSVNTTKSICEPSQNITNKTAIVIEKNPKPCNCEIVEDNLSPVRETTKNLEHILSLPSYDKPLSHSPKIPKVSRFGRLNLYLEKNSEECSISPDAE